MPNVFWVIFCNAGRRLALSPHATEINDNAFRLARDIMVEVAVLFQAEVAELIIAMEKRGLMTLKPETTPAALAQPLCDGARGTNQSLPPIPSEELIHRYRAMMRAILYGAARPASGE